MQQVIKLNSKYPGLNIQEGEITRTYQGKSRKGVITYCLYKQEILINGVKHIVKGADENWLKLDRDNLYDEQYKLYRKNYKPQPKDPNVTYVMEGSNEGGLWVVVFWVVMMILFSVFVL